LDLHPYTRFRVRCLGETNGHFAMFAVPTGSLSLLLEFFEELRSTGLIKGYRYDVAISSWTHTETDFDYYDVEDDSWSFDWGWCHRGLHRKMYRFSLFWVEDHLTP